MAYAEFVVIELLETITTLGLACFAKVFQQGSDLVGILHVVGGADRGHFVKRGREGRGHAYTSKMTLAISVNRNGSCENSGSVVSRVRRSCRKSDVVRPIGQPQTHCQ
jgi:hypothetical protein